MKTLELKLKKDVLIVDLEDNEATHIKGYEFLCEGSELTEEIASELVEKMRFSFSKAFLDYRPYIYSPNHFKSAIKSFISAVESKSFYWLENLIEIIERGEDTEHNRVLNQNEWQEAEAKTFRNPLIFVKK